MAEEGGKEKERAPKTAPPTAPPPIITQLPRRGGRQWPMLVAYVVVALIVAAGVVFGGRWIYNTVREEPAEETGQPAATSESPAVAPSQPSPTASTTPSPSPNQSTATRGEQIANTGPGQTIAIFVGASALAGATHYILTRRKTRNF